MKRYITSLDGIRGVGIVFVLLYHYMRLNGIGESVLGFSWVWIQLFFVQSGFLISKILLGSKQLSLKKYLGNFYWNRILRIFPIYFGYIIVFVFIYLAFHKPPDFLDRLPYLVTYTYNYTRLIPDMEFNNIWFIHFWSLAVEEQFYLVWPFVIYFLKPRQLKALIIGIIVVVPVIRYWLGIQFAHMGYEEPMLGEILYAFTLCQFDAFAFGAAIPVFGLEKRFSKVQGLRAWMYGVLALCLIAGLWNYSAILQHISDYSFTSLGYTVAYTGNLQHVWSYSLINALFMFVVLYLLLPTYKGLFTNKFFVSAGKVVYGMYIFHFVILYLMLKVDQLFIHNFYISFILAFLITYAAAYISYQYFEKRILSFKKRS